MTFELADVLDEGQLTSRQKVYCVICMDADHARDLVHVFSTQAKATAFADADHARDHIIYDYVIDCPERMEGRTQ
jgi:hypothetical protein